MNTLNGGEGDDRYNYSLIYKSRIDDLNDTYRKMGQDIVADGRIFSTIATNHDHIFTAVDKETGRVYDYDITSDLDAYFNAEVVVGITEQ